jgi:hypothetical protein
VNHFMALTDGSKERVADGDVGAALLGSVKETQAVRATKAGQRRRRVRNQGDRDDDRFDRRGVEEALGGALAVSRNFCEAHPPQPSYVPVPRDARFPPLRRRHRSVLKKLR